MRQDFPAGQQGHACPCLPAIIQQMPPARRRSEKVVNFQRLLICHQLRTVAAACGVQQSQRAAKGKGHVNLEQMRVEGEGGGDGGALSGPKAEQIARAKDQVGQCAAGDHDAFGRAGRTRGEDDECRVVGFCGGAAWVLAALCHGPREDGAA